MSCSKLSSVDEYGWPLPVGRNLPFTVSNSRVIRHLNLFKTDQHLKFLSISRDDFKYCEFWLDSLNNLNKNTAPISWDS